MTRNAKIGAGFALPVILILALLVWHRLGQTQGQNGLHEKYQHTRMQIGWQLVKLRQEYGTKQIHISQNTAVEIRMLWDGRDVLYHSLNGRKSPFQSDSIIKLERLIDRRAPLTTVLREIERIEQINETD